MYLCARVRVFCVYVRACVRMSVRMRWIKQDEDAIKVIREGSETNLHNLAASPRQHGAHPIGQVAYSRVPTSLEAHRR